MREILDELYAIGEALNTTNALRGRQIKGLVTRLRRAVDEYECILCGHSKVDNKHGFDQYDMYMNGDKVIHTGRCTYCK